MNVRGRGSENSDICGQGGQKWAQIWAKWNNPDHGLRGTLTWESYVGILRGTLTWKSYVGLLRGNLTWKSYVGLLRVNWLSLVYHVTYDWY